MLGDKTLEWANLSEDEKMAARHSIRYAGRRVASCRSWSPVHINAPRALGMPEDIIRRLFCAAADRAMHLCSVLRKEEEK